MAPFGQGDKRPSALLHSFALAMASPALVRLAAERFSSCCTRQYRLDGVLKYERLCGASWTSYFVRIPNW